MNIMADSDAIKKLVGGPIDVFTMNDVLEHIPNEARIDLFASLYNLGSADAKILITIPSEFYQEFLRLKNPKELQIIDNTLTPDLLTREGREAGFAITYYKVLDMWQHVQYAHCIMQKIPALQARAQDVARQKVEYSILRLGVRVANKLFLRKRRRKRYVDDVFGAPNPRVTGG
jgi:hypothetical protein